MKLKVDYFSQWSLVLLVLAFCQVAIAQRTITGTVTDSQTGEALIGANILVVGTSTGTVTDFDGTYTLNVPEDATQLEFSYTGYASQTVTIGTSTVIDIALSAGELLDEIVVTGYTTQKAREVTSAITSVDEKDFNAGNVTNPAQLLQGKVAGLTISQPGNNPNETPQIRLRGLSTIGANTSPLVVIDGVIGADLNTVDPTDIASISVLKDGSAAAIYGTRGASGVIIVTTKKGAAGTATVNYNVYGTADVITKKVPVLDAAGYRRFGGSNITDFGANTDWIDEITDTGLSQTHNLSVSGGTGKFAYRAAVNYRDNDGVALNTGFKQFNGRLNLSQKALNDRLTISIDLTATDRKQQNGFNEAFRYATIYNPTAPIRDESNPEFVELYDGYFQQVLFDFYNPVAILEQNVNESTRKLLLGNVRGEYEIVRGLKVAAQYSLQRTNATNGQYRSKKSFWQGRDRNGRANIRNDEDESQYFLSTISWVENVGSSLNVNLLGGYEYQQWSYEGFGMEGGDFLTDAFSYHNMAASQDFQNGLGTVFSYKNNYRNIAFFARAQLTWNNTYFLTASLRREGNSRFGQDNKWGMFPAISGGITLSNLFNMGFDNFKVRAGWGRTGNLPARSYISLQRFGPSGNFLVNGEWLPSYSPVSNANPDLKWETKDDISLGVDFATLDYRLTGSVDFFSTTTNDLIIPFDVPVPPNLFGSTEINIGQLRNQGLEFVLGFQAISKPNFTWNTSVNFTYYLANELVTLSTETFEFGGVRDVAGLGAPGQNNTPLVRIEEGKPIGQLWGLEYVGVDESGRWIHKDNNGDGLISNEDRAVLGSGLPKSQFGWNNQFTFGNLDFGFFLDGYAGHDLINTFRAFYEAASTISSYNVLETSYDGDLAKLTDSPKFSSLHVENAAFLRLNNASLGYTFKFDPDQAFSRIRLYLTGERLFYITSYKGVDPTPRLFDSIANNDTGGVFGPLAPGIDRRDTWYRTAAVSLGAQFTF